MYVCMWGRGWMPVFCVGDGPLFSYSFPLAYYRHGHEKLNIG